MKKFIPLLAALAILTITGCGTKDSADTAASTISASEQTTAVQAEAAASTQVQTNAVGNSTSNYTNNGSSAIFGKDIYYIGKEDGKRGIYKINNDTGVVELLAETSGQDLSTIDGTVYYLNEGSIYKVASKTAPEPVKEDGGIIDMCANSNWIYYIKKDDKGLGKVFKVMYSGSGETMVTPKSSPTDDIQTLTYANDRLYFSDAAGVGYMYLDGSNKTYMITGYQVSDYGVYGDYLYFVYQGQIFRIKQGGSSEAVQCDAANVQKINIAGDVMYIISDSGIGTMNTNGGSVTPISPEKPTSVSISGNYIFGTKGMFFYRIKTDGSDAVSFK